MTLDKDKISTEFVQRASAVEVTTWRVHDIFLIIQKPNNS